MFPGLTKNAYLFDHFMTRLTNKAPGNAMPILPLEASVTVGRSSWAYKRNGLLELQERLIDEILIAAVWLYGVSSMRKAMDWVIRKFQANGKLKSLYTEADWSKKFMSLFLPGKKSPTLALSPIQRFGYSFNGMMKTMGVKSVKWGISLIVPSLLCGYIIPKLNRVKTIWLMKHFYTDKQPLEKAAETKQKVNTFQHQPQFFPQAKQPYQAFNQPNSSFAQPQFNTPGTYPATIQPYQQVAFAGQDPQPIHTTRAKNQKPRDLRFGFSGAAGYGALSKVAHWVNNTAFGEFLAMDAVLTGGRMATAWPYSKYESFEYGFRDGFSAFLYMDTVPLIMKGIHKLFGKRTETILELDNQVIRRQHEKMLRQLHVQGIQRLTQAQLDNLLYGATNTSLLEKAKALLGNRLSEAKTEALLDTFKRELRAFYAKADISALTHPIETLLKADATVTTDKLLQTLQAIWNRSGNGLDKLTQAQQYHLATALQNAMHHTAGMTFDDLAAKLGISAEEAMKLPFFRSAELHADQNLATMLRRSLNAVGFTQKAHHELLKDMDNIICSVERAVIEGVPVRHFVPFKLRFVMDEYDKYLADLGTSAKGNALRAEFNVHKTRILNALAGQEALAEDQLKAFTTFLKINGRTMPKGLGWLRWMKGPGMGHLAKQVDLVIPLIPADAANRSLNPMLWMQHKIERLMSRMISETQHSSFANQRQLIEYYASRVKSLLPNALENGGATRGEGRLAFMVETASKELEEHFKQAFLGGIKNDPYTYYQGLQVIDHMPMDTASFVDPKAAGQFKQKLMDPYFDIIERKAKALIQKSGSISVDDFKAILEGVAKRNRSWRMGAWTTGLVLSMAGLSLLVPKLQYLMTKYLTGSDNHPGLAAVAHKMEEKAAA